MVTKPHNKLKYDAVDAKIAAFDEWVSEQPEAVQKKVEIHIASLVKDIPTIGDKSAKLLLSEVYLVARRHIHIENKYGVLEI